MRTIHNVIRIFFIAATISICAPLTTAAQELPMVNAIEVQGLKRIEEGAAKSRISQKTGQPVSQENISEDIKALFKMGYFEDVRVEMDPSEGGVRLIYIVKEKPTIVRVEFQGNREFDEEKLREKISVITGAIGDSVLIQDNAAKLKKFYEEEGHALATVVPVLRRIREDEISLTYQIEEGSKIKIDRIVFDGNQNISSSRLKKAIETKEWWFLSFFTSSGYYKKDEMEKDIERIKAAYYDAGYLSVVIAEPEVRIDRQKQSMTIAVRISEGPRYSVSSIDAKGNKAIDSETIRKKLLIRPGERFSKSRLDKDIEAVTSIYTDDGYAMATVIPDISPDEKNKTVQINLNVGEGERYRIGRIEVSGNARTRDKVIRREVRLDEGDIFSSSKLRRSYERIHNLNFFEQVELVPSPRPETRLIDLDIRVKERATGTLSVGGGYSSVDKLIAMVDLTEGNLFGKGQAIKIKGEMGSKTTNYEISFRDPWFLDRPVSMSTGLYRNYRDYSQYKKHSFGFFMGFGKSLSEYWHADASYHLERAEISSVSANASTTIKDQEGRRTTSSISPSIARDSRDNYLDPSRGSRNTIGFTYAGLGGDNYFIKGAVDSAWFFPIGQTTAMIKGRFGIGRGISGKKFPLYERYYVGGIYTVRGLGYGAAGPQDESSGEPIGGTEELIFNAEYLFPLIPEMRLKGVLFFDAGNAYEDFHDFGRLRYGSGFGFRWISPIGPIRIEWGYNIDKKPGESPSRFEFAFGTFF